jgi:hypothetical protein
MSKILPPVPERLEVSNEAGDLVIRRKWLSWKAAPLALFATVWDAFLVFWYFAAFRTGRAELIMVLFPLLHVAAGAAITYYVLCLFLNTTRIRISPNRVKIETGPLPWRGNGELMAADIRDTRVHVRHNKDSVSFALRYVDAANRERGLGPGFDEEKQAEYVEYFIRQAAGLPACAADDDPAEG